MLDKKDIKFIIILLLLNCIFFYKVLLNPDGLFYPAMDLTRIYSPMEYFISNSIHSFHQLPLWNPYIFSGISFIGNPISLMLYPLNFLFVIFPSNSMFGLLIMFHVFMAGFFTYLFMRLIKAKRVSSLIAAIIFMFSGVFIVRLPVFANLIVVSYVPVVFFLAELLLQRRNIKIAIFLGIALTLQFITGHAQNFLYANTALVVYLIIRLLFVFKEEKQFKSLFRIIKLFSLSVIICICLSAVYLIPALETTTKMTRSEGTDYAYGTATSLNAADLLTFLCPDIYGVETGYPRYNTYWRENYNVLYGYIGLLSLILALFALLFRRNKYTWTFFAVSVFAVLFALGKNTPFYYIIYNSIPFFKLFRGPSKMLFMYIFSMSILAGIGSGFLFEKIKKNQAKLLNWLKRLLIIGLILSLLILILLLLNKGSVMNIGESMVRVQYAAGNKLHPLDYYLNRVELIYNELIKNVSFVSFILFCSIMILNYKVRNPKRTRLRNLKTAVIILIVLDLFFYAMPKIEYVKDQEDIFAKNDLIKFLENDKSYFRIIDTERSIGQELAIRSNLYLVDGYDAVILSEYNEFIDLMTEKNKGLYVENTLEFDKLDASKIKNYNIPNLLNVKYILTDEELNNNNPELAYNATVYIERLDIYKDVKIYENKDVLPRAFVVRNADIIKEKEEIFDKIKTFDPKKEVILEEEYKGVSKDNEGEFKEAEIVFYSPNKITINVSLNNPGFLVVSEIYYPGWRAYDNNREVKMMKADYILRSVYLEEGEHQVEFVYDPLSYKIGKAITLLTILSILIYFIVTVTKNKNDRAKNKTE